MESKGDARRWDIPEEMVSTCDRAGLAISQLPLRLLT